MVWYTSCKKGLMYRASHNYKELLSHPDDQIIHPRDDHLDVIWYVGIVDMCGTNKIVLANGFRIFRYTRRTVFSC